jgi:hypothetical protein
VIREDFALPHDRAAALIVAVVIATGIVLMSA